MPKTFRNQKTMWKRGRSCNKSILYLLQINPERGLRRIEIMRRLGIYDKGAITRVGKTLNQMVRDKIILRVYLKKNWCLFYINPEVSNNV